MTETILQTLERGGHTDPLDNEVYCILKTLEARANQPERVQSRVAPTPAKKRVSTRVFTPKFRNGINRMWEGGPLRLWSSEPKSAWVPYATGGYVGPYVCTECSKEVSGVYEPRYVCSACRNNSQDEPDVSETTWPDEPKNEPARIADAADLSLPNEQMPFIAPQPVANDTADSHGDVNTLENVPDAPVLDAGEPTDAPEVTLSPETVLDAVSELSVTSIENSFTCEKELPVRRKPNPWRAYEKPDKPIGEPVARVTYPDRPERARDQRKDALRNAVYVPDYVKQAKIQEQDNCCIYCDRLFGSPILHTGKVEILEPQAEHFKPRSAAGRTSDGNLKYACHVCNKLKSDYLFETVEEVKVWLVQEWALKEYATCPPLVPFKMSAMTAASCN